MRRPKVEWDPSWDDDWQAAQPDLEAQIEADHPPQPERAVEYYRYGFSAAKRHPLHEWPDVQRELYEDYMTGLAELEEEERPGEGERWEQARVWAHRGWEAGAKPHIHVYRRYAP